MLSRVLGAGPGWLGTRRVRYPYVPEYAGRVGALWAHQPCLPSSTASFNLLDLTCLIGAVTACHHFPGSHVNWSRLTGLRCSCLGRWASRAR